MKNGTYHNVVDKLYQKFIGDEEQAGYTISTKPMKIGGTLWSKVIEGGIDITDRKGGSPFKSMINELTTIEHSEPVNYIIEVNKDEPQVLGLLLRSGFEYLLDIEQAKEIMTGFLKSDGIDFELSAEENGLEITRTTGINKDPANPYHGYLIVNQMSALDIK